MPPFAVICILQIYELIDNTFRSVRESDAGEQARKSHPLKRLTFDAIPTARYDPALTGAYRENNAIERESRNLQSGEKKSVVAFFLLGIFTNL